MPRIRNYYPVSHNLNRDPQFQELRRRTKDWMGYCWHEMLAIADHNDGVLRGKPEAIAMSLAHVSLSNRPRSACKHILIAFQLMCDYGWIEMQFDRILIVKYADYHKSRNMNNSHEEINKLPTNQLTNKQTNNPLNPLMSKAAGTLTQLASALALSGAMPGERVPLSDAELEERKSLLRSQANKIINPT